MDAKISSTTWNDPDFDDFTPEMVLTLYWMKTNPDRNACGAYRFSASRFQFETKGLDPSWHDKTRLALGELMLSESHWFIYLPFIRECLWLGAGKKAAADHRAKALAKPFEALPKPFREKLVEEYPQFRPIWMQETGYQAEENPNNFRNAVDSEALGKGLPSPCQGQSKEEQSKEKIGSGECEGGEVNGSIVPGEEEVLAYAMAFRDLARGIGPISEGYALKWLAWRAEDRAGQFPRDWKADLRRRFLGDAVTGKIAVQSTAPRSRKSEIENRLKTTANPEERARLREELRKLTEVAA